KRDGKVVHEQVDGWTVIARTRAVLDQFTSAQKALPSLATSGVYRDATARLPADALATLFVNGGPVDTELRSNGVGAIPGLGHLRWAAGAVRAQGDGVSLELHANGDRVDLATYSPALVNRPP